MLLPKGLFGDRSTGIQILRISLNLTLKLPRGNPLSREGVDTVYFTRHITEYLVKNPSHIRIEHIDNKTELNWHMKMIH
jgi:hypothetical protein